MLRATLYSLALLIAATIFAKNRSRDVRQSILLIASYALYVTWGAWFAAVLFGSTVMNYLFGEWLRRKSSSLVLSTGIMLNLALLGSFKYLPGIAVNLPFSSLQRFAHLALPLGISFWTFQAMSYLFDLYQGEELDPSFLEFALYMVFFPIAISGPICRMPDMLLQFRSEKALAWENVRRGLGRVAIGVLMMQTAKLLGHGILGGDGINSGFDRVGHWSGMDVWCLVFGYGLQLFFDFAGYSHIAIGAAQVLGITVPENFDRPFRSTTPSIFWTRWHMSLSFWIRDYVFLPLAMLRREVWWRNAGLVIAMLLFGLWHKATVLFVLWGCYHGVLLVLHRQVQAMQRRFNWTPQAHLWEPASWAATISLISLGWVFFRANTLNQATEMLLAAISPSTFPSHFLTGSFYLLTIGLASAYAIVRLVSYKLDSAERQAGEIPRGGAIALVARWRWFWIPPLYVMTLLFVVGVTVTQSADTAQFMYRTF